MGVVTPGAGERQYRSALPGKSENDCNGRKRRESEFSDRKKWGKG